MFNYLHAKQKNIFYANIHPHYNCNYFFACNSSTTFDSSIEVTSIDTSKTTTASKLLTNPLTTIDLTLPKIEAAQIMIENNPAIYERYGGDAELLKLKLEARPQLIELYNKMENGRIPSDHIELKTWEDRKQFFLNSWNVEEIRVSEALPSIFQNKLIEIFLEDQQVYLAITSTDTIELTRNLESTSADIKLTFTDEGLQRFIEEETDPSELIEEGLLTVTSSDSSTRQWELQIENSETRRSKESTLSIVNTKTQKTLWTESHKIRKEGTSIAGKAFFWQDNQKEDDPNKLTFFQKLRIIFLER